MKKPLVPILITLLLVGAGFIYFSDFNLKNIDTPREQDRQKDSTDDSNSKQDQSSDNEQEQDSNQKQDSDSESELEKAENDLITVDKPRKDQEVTSPLLIEGKAKGEWYFEGTFPVTLTDWDGKIIAEENAQAQGDWMTEDFVPFKVELTFEKPELYERGSLILQKANPSGLPKNDSALEFTINFK